MASLVNCVKYCCYKLCTTVGLTQPYPTQFSPSDEGERVSIMNQYQSEQARSLKGKSKPRTREEHPVNDIVGIDGVLMGEKKPQSLAVPTKDNQVAPTNAILINTEATEPKEEEPYVFNVDSFKIQLQAYQTYYEVLHSKTKNLSQKLNVPSTPIELEKAPCGLRIRHSQSGKLNILIYRFKLPCSHAFYNEMLNDYALQKSLDSNIDEYKLLELYSNNFRLNYLSYKKVLIVSPRDFVYLKYSNSQGKEKWDVSFSIPWENIPHKVRGEIIMSCSKVTEKGDSIEVEVYSEVDMKLSVSPKITKNQAVNEIKKYVQKCQKYIKQNYKPSLI